MCEELICVICVSEHHAHSQWYNWMVSTEIFNAIARPFLWKMCKHVPIWSLSLMLSKSRQYNNILPVIMIQSLHVFCPRYIKFTCLREVSFQTYILARVLIAYTCKMDNTCYSPLYLQYIPYNMHRVVVSLVLLCLDKELLHTMPYLPISLYEWYG